MTDYDDLCNGNGEWKNIQPVMRSALFGQAQDMIALKAHLVEFSKKLQAQEAVSKEILLKLSRPDPELSKKQQALEDKFTAFQRTSTQKLDDFEEKLLEVEHFQKQKIQNLTEIVQKLSQKHEISISNLDKNMFQQTEMLQNLKQKTIQETTQLSAKFDTFLTKTQLEQTIDNYTPTSSLTAQLQTLRQDLQNQLQQLQSQTKTNFETLKTSNQNQHTATLNQIEKIVTDNATSIPTSQDISDISKTIFVEQIKHFASKNVVQSIAQKLNDRIQQLSLQNTEKTTFLQEENNAKFAEFSQNLHSTQQKQAELQNDISSKLLELTVLKSFDKKLKDLEVQMSFKLDTNSLNNSKFVTRDVLEDEFHQLQNATQRQIKAEVEGFVDNSLYRTVKSIIKAELDIQATHVRHDLEDRFKENQDGLMKKIMREISPHESLQKLDQNIEDIRQLIEMVANDVDFKLVKQNEENEQKLTCEISAVRHAIDSIQNVLSSQNDLVSCKLKEFDLTCNNSSNIIVPTAKWLWKNKKLSSQNSIIWSEEAQNTLQSNFLWEKGKSQILIVSPGCYQVQFVVFSRKRPTIQIMVNGECVISAMSGGVGTTLYSTPKGAGSQTFYGQSLVDFLYLGGNSVVQLSIGTEFSSCLSGFMQLQRMW
ncbi:hypothetical protein SS50377_27243 [Spironucleus salmonicida]|uniref:C1q domain-containing protein n=1 Tax=Spironucleus salmonicida TaxID=348837 RepID=V6LIF9_9EUKA|nr:hypothetical protein SS50377_28731 [Spironucleus salmonicida]KAH0570950.1 hypothetical protein SS50377_27243 [Spironucleus salmonicida]|eukprot:EST44327.1 hypothetical protein SS50377_15866 [Spironucleus salmonicida]